MYISLHNLSHLVDIVLENFEILSFLLFAIFCVFFCFYFFCVILSQSLTYSLHNSLSISHTDILSQWTNFLYVMYRKNIWLFILFFRIFVFVVLLKNWFCKYYTLERLKGAKKGHPEERLYAFVVGKDFGTKSAVRTWVYEGRNEVSWGCRLCRPQRCEAHFASPPLMPFLLSPFEFRHSITAERNVATHQRNLWE